MADALNEFFDRAGSALNRNLPGNRAFGLSIDPTKDSKSATWPHSLYDGKGVIRRGSDGKVVASTGYLEPFIKVYRKDANGNLNLEIITENQEKAATIGSAINPRTNPSSSSFLVSSFVSPTPFASPLLSTDVDGNTFGFAGFTPPIYYKYKSDVWSSDFPERFIELNGEYLSTTKDKFNFITEGYKKFKDPSYEFKTAAAFNKRLTPTLQDQDSKILYSQPSSDSKISQFQEGEILSRTDNEDPVFFGFEIIIDVDNSPLFNGELETFIDSIGGSYEEVRSRKEIVSEFKKEFIRYFKMSSDLSPEPTTSIFSTSSRKKYYYVNKIVGLQKLNEYNTSGKNSAFVNYETDLITLTFLEDTTLNLGTLYSLYKLIYWSRLRGKSIIPENLLRFDCKIIVSELRNFVRVRRSVSSGDGYEVLKDNLSRYVYNLYECQFFFDKPTHPDGIDMSTPATPTTSYDVSLNYKYSNMTFERFSGDFNGNGSYQKLSNIYINPNLSTNPTASQSNAYLLRNDVNISLENYPGDSTTSMMSEIFDDTNPFADLNRERVSDLKNRQKSQQSTRLKNLYGQIQNDVAENKPKGLFRQAGEKFLNNLKTAGLMEAQRQINTRFALLNRSLDRIRNSFGIGRMSDPTNVYDFGATYNRTFINDVRNSLRTFAGESLTALITGG